MSLIGLDIGTTGCKAIVFGARSDLWLQLKADICDISLRVPEVTEAACLGAALLAGTATGAYVDLPTAVFQTVHLETRIAPRPASVTAYEQRFQIYRQIYPTLHDLNHILQGQASLGNRLKITS